MKTRTAPLHWLITLFSAFLVGATVLPLVRKKAWWIRLFDFPRLQIAIGQVGAGAALLFACPGIRIAKPLLAALLASVTYQAYKIYPYSPLAAKEVPGHGQERPERTLSILSANILQENRDYDRFLETVKSIDPDLVLAVEADEDWAKALGPLAETRPYVVACPLNNSYGMVLYSRLALIETRVIFLAHPDVPSIHSTCLLRSGDRINIHCLHPKPPRPRTGSSAERDAELVILSKDVVSVSSPTIVMGDLNDVGWSDTSNMFRRLSGLLDPRVGRGLFNTFNAKSFLFRFPLDHVFHSNHFRLVDFKRLPHIGSDHFPIFIRLSYEP